MLINIDFQNLTLPTTPNYYLACPENYCNNKPGAITPSFPYNREQLIKNVNAILNQQPRIKILAENKNQLTYVQRSRIFRFPDFITINFIAIDNNQSTLAIYSRSKYGRSDLGVNKKRVTTLLNQLKK